MVRCIKFKECENKLCPHIEPHIPYMFQNKDGSDCTNETLAEDTRLCKKRFPDEIIFKCIDCI